MKYYLIGISGIGMSALAFLLKELGHEVIGSTNKKNYICSLLEKENIKVFYGHKKENLDKSIDFVVYSSAIKEDHVERKQAEKLGITLLHRSDVLKDLINLHKKNVLVTGTHGKTTTTSLISYIFFKAKKSFSSYIGGLVDFLGNKNAKFDKRLNIIICEADESDKSFLKYSPYYALVTNIDKDHLDVYKDEEDIKESFLKFINTTNSVGKVFISLKNSIVDISFLEKIGKKFVYVTSRQEYQNKKTFLRKLKYVDYVLNYEKISSKVKVYKNDKLIFEYKPSIVGEHNILNTLLAIGVSLENKIPLKVIKQALETFKNAKRRLEVVYENKKLDILIFDDYAHHPAELESVISALKELYSNSNKTVYIIFQPHRYSRFFNLKNEFLKVIEKYKNDFNIYLTSIFSAGEKNVYNLDIKNICKKNGIKYIENIDKIPIKKNSIYVTVGAGDIYKWALKLKQLIEKKEKENGSK